MSSWELQFLTNLEAINTALGGDPIVLPEPRSFQADSLLMLSAIALAAANAGGSADASFARGRFGRRSGVMVIDGGDNFSVTRTSAGFYEVAFITPRPSGDTNYLVVASTAYVADEQLARSPRTPNPRNYTNAGFQLYCAISGGGEDQELVNFVVYDL